jgi:rhomboid protease GluP
MVVSGVSFFEPSVQDLVTWGADFKPLVAGGEWWRLFTCMFVHVGILHVAFNMYALFFIGVYLEPLLGRMRYTVAYLAAGLLSSVTSSWWHGNDFVSVGASGAIFGLYGVFLALLTTNIVDKRARKSLMTSVGIFVAYNLFYGFSHKEVDNSAHIGGLLSGLLIGYVFYFTFREPSEKKNRNVSVVLTLATLVVTSLYLSGIKDDNLKFEVKYNEFIELQNEAVAPLQKDSLLFNLELGRQLRDVSLPDWKKAQLVMDSTLPFKLNAAYSKKRELAIQYAKLRIEHVELLIKTIDTNTGDASKYQGQLEEIVDKMKVLIDQMDAAN